MSVRDCPFCAIAAGDMPASVIFDDGQVLAFMDQRQAVAGHVLIIPRRHVPDIYALEMEEAAAIMRLAVRVARALRMSHDPPGLNLWQSNGRAGGQEVGHFHLHVHPREHEDGLLRIYPDGAPPNRTPAQLDLLAASLRECLAS